MQQQRNGGGDVPMYAFVRVQGREGEGCTDLDGTAPIWKRKTLGSFEVNEGLQLIIKLQFAVLSVGHENVRST